MSYYYSLRGWLEMSHEEFPRIREKLLDLQHNYAEDEQSSLYMKGWCWINDEINAKHYLFYGASVRLAGLDLLESVLDALTALGCKIYGYFHAEGEDMESNYMYKITNDIWTVAETSFLIDWTGDD